MLLYTSLVRSCAFKWLAAKLVILIYARELMSEVMAHATDKLKDAEVIWTLCIPTNVNLMIIYMHTYAVA